MQPGVLRVAHKSWQFFPPNPRAVFHPYEDPEGPVNFSRQLSEDRTMSLPSAPPFLSRRSPFRPFRGFALTLLALLCVAPLWGSWMEEINPGNTADDKARIERENRRKQAAASATLANLKYAVSLIDASLKKGTGEVRLSWMDVEEPTAVYRVYRANDPIDSDEALAKATRLGTVKAGVQQFLDTLEAPGRYFYAVTAEVNGQEVKVFLNDQSTTATPLIYSVKTTELYVANLKFFYNRTLRSVFLRWNDPDSKEIFDVLIYRSLSPFDQMDRVTNREPLAVVAKGEESYQDNTIALGNAYHYALVIKRKFSPSFETFLQPKVNTEGPVNIPLESGARVSGSALADAMGAMEPPKTNTPLPPAPVVTNTPPPVTNQAPPTPVVTNAAPVVTNVPPPVPATNVAPKVIEDPRPGVVTNVIIISNINPVEETPRHRNIEVEPAPPPVAPVKAIPPQTLNLLVLPLPGEKAVSLVWQAGTNVDKPFYFNIYRSLEPIQSATQLVEGGSLVETQVIRGCVRGEKFEWRDTGAPAGRNLWYAVLIDSGQGLRDQELHILDNFIKYPVKLPAVATEKEERAPAPETAWRKPGESDGENARLKADLRQQVRDLFSSGQYALLIERLAVLESRSNLDGDNRSMVWLYLGRSHLGLGQKAKALEYFFKLRGIDEDSGTFWIQRAVDSAAAPRKSPPKTLEP